MFNPATERSGPLHGDATGTEVMPGESVISERSVRRVAQAFDLAGITNTMGAPFLRAVCEGRESRTHTQSGSRGRDKKMVLTASRLLTASRPALAKNARTGHPR